ncbi:MAG: lysylphosphatidylglycerol synthase domain-containing protein [Candidatus Brocadiia bacterium]
MDSRKLRQAASMTFLALALLGGAVYVYFHRDRFGVILDVPLAAAVALLAGGVLFRSLEGVFLRMVVIRLGGEMDVPESQMLAWATGYWNLLPAKPGTGALAIYLKHRHGLPYSGFLAYLLTMNVLRMVVDATLGLLASLPLCLWSGLTPVLPVAFGAVLAGCVVIIYLPTGWRYTGDNRVLRAIANTGRAWQRMRRMRGLLWRIGLLRFGCGFAAALAMLVSFRAVGVGAGYLQAVAAMELSAFSRFATLVPAQLGVREALTGLAAMGFGFAFSDGVVAAALRRAVVMPVILLLGPLASWRLHRRGGVKAGRPTEPGGPTEQDVIEDLRT